MSDPVMPIHSSPDIETSSPTSFVLYTVLAVGLAVVIRLFIAAPYVVSGASMEPNFQDWNYLIVDRLSYDISAPQRGDVVVFKLPQDTSRALIKRVIGLPGETVVISGPNPTVTIINASHPQGFTLQEPYIAAEDFGGSSGMRVTLAADQYFVLGDNRKVSADSRVWGILPRADMVGRVLLRLYPLNEFGFLPEESRYTESATTSTQ
jgi:signal peptidase I